MRLLISGTLIVLCFALNTLGALSALLSPPDSLFPSRTILTAKVGLVLGIIFVVIGALAAIKGYKQTGRPHAPAATWVKEIAIGLIIVTVLYIIYLILASTIVSLIRNT